ncbi:MAG TPA: hypothetical protein VES39_04315, partial [Rhodospirillales bacterium]|nr:hypothetical protein [Rhodospirillales bacterium]
IWLHGTFFLRLTADTAPVHASHQEDNEQLGYPWEQTPSSLYSLFDAMQVRVLQIVHMRRLA